MGSRGPLKGRGGRPPATGPKARSTTASRVRTAAKKSGSLVPGTSGNQEPASPDQWLADLTDLSWENFVAYCGQWRPLSPGDRVEVVTFWDTVEQYRSLKTYVTKLTVSKWFFETEKGHRNRSPEIVELRTLREAIRDYAFRFGLDPASRVRLGDDAPLKHRATPFAEYLKASMSVDAQAQDEYRKSAIPSRAVRRPSAKREASGGKTGTARPRKAPQRPGRAK